MTNHQTPGPEEIEIAKKVSVEVIRLPNIA
jgi:hypothetical protein